MPTPRRALAPHVGHGHSHVVRVLGRLAEAGNDAVERPVVEAFDRLTGAIPHIGEQRLGDISDSRVARNFARALDNLIEGRRRASRAANRARHQPRLTVIIRGRRIAARIDARQRNRRRRAVDPLHDSRRRRRVAIGIALDRTHRTVVARIGREQTRRRRGRVRYQPVVGIGTDGAQRLQLRLRHTCRC